MTKIRLLIASALLSAVSAIGQGTVMFNPTNGLLLIPTNFWSANASLNAASLEYLGWLSESINGGVPNGSGARVHWSELLGVPAGFADGTDDGAGGGSGTVTSVELSLPAMFSVSGTPVTTNGTLAATLATQAANAFFVGPSSGGAASPTFRALATNDLPATVTLDDELTGSINAGSPNGSGASVHWSRLLGVPAGIADGTDDGGAATGVLNVLPLTPSGATNHVVDFAFPVLTFSATNDVFLLQSTNRPSVSTNALQTTVFITGGSSDRQLGWNSTWNVIGNYFTVIPSNKLVLVSLECVGTNESGVVVSMARTQ